MNRSTKRVLTTHVGSLPRPESSMKIVQDALVGRSVDEKLRLAELKSAVAEILKKQVDIGLDVVDDGELSKPSFITYVNERLGGFEPGGPKGNRWKVSREYASFPTFYEEAAKRNPARTHMQMLCTGPITYKGHVILQRDLENLKNAVTPLSIQDVFVPSISPSNIEDWQKNAYYRTPEEFLFAIADAMHEEYKAIVDAGFLVQIDDPRLATYFVLHPETTMAEYRKWMELHIEAINHALSGISEDRVRFHTCYGINMGPRIHDVELKDIVDLILKIHAGAYSFEASNPRHEHEWRVWQDVKLPDGKLIIPGVITQSTVLVEHPELVAERIIRFANVVGRENVIAGADCGFSSFAGSLEIHADIVWAKFRSLVEGARLASRELWKNAN